LESKIQPIRLPPHLTVIITFQSRINIGSDGTLARAPKGAPNLFSGAPFAVNVLKKQKIIYRKILDEEKKGKAINIDYGNIDFENDIIESLRSTRS